VYVILDGEKESLVRQFLLSVKWAMQKSDRGGRGWIFSTATEKNIDTVTELEMTLEDVKREILSLSVIDYCSGPLIDPAITGDVWIFGKHIRGKEVYIKLKLWGDERDQEVRVLSFHIAQAPLSYYFKHQS